MKSIKTEVVVSYTTILDLASAIRSLLSPYRQFATAVNVQQINRPEERVLLIYEDDGYILDCNWNRIAFVGEGKRDSYYDENGQLRFFFELVEKIKNLDSFGRFTSLTANFWDLLDEGKHVFADPEPFRENMLAEGLPRFKGKTVDARVDVHYTDGKLKYNVACGPFLPEDIEKNNLSIFPQRSDTWRSELMSLSGMLVNVQMQRQQNIIDFGLFQEILRNYREVISRFQ